MEAGTKFAPGAEVQLMSGGPIMTVVRYSTYSHRDGYLCQWFDSKVELRSEVFEEPVLKAVQPIGGPVRVMRG